LMAQELSPFFNSTDGRGGQRTMLTAGQDYGARI